MSVQKLLVVYATIHGHAASIARRIADAAVRAGGVTADVHDVAETLPSAVEHYDAVVLVGSVHHGTHPRILQRFAGAAADALRNRRTAFVSVTLSTATKEAYEDAADTVFEFFQETQWVPQTTTSSAPARGRSFRRHARFARSSGHSSVGRRPASRCPRTTPPPTGR
jgi:menaquinone-dependent protoporphyrinogen IX oxidase